MTDFLIPLLDRPEKVSLRSIADIDAMGFDIGSEERKTVPRGTEYNLVGMESEMKFFGEKILYFRNRGLEEFPTRVDEDKIIHVSPIVSDFEGFFDE